MVGGDSPHRFADYSSEADGDTDTSGVMDVDITNQFDENEVLPEMVIPWPIIAVVLGVWVIYACIYVAMEVGPWVGGWGRSS